MRIPKSLREGWVEATVWVGYFLREFFFFSNGFDYLLEYTE